MGPRRQPRPLASALEVAIDPLAPATALGGVQRAWEAAVGPTVAAEASPVSERDGVILVACRSATWAQELELLGAEILDKLRSHLPDGVEVKGLRFNATGVSE